MGPLIDKLEILIYIRREKERSMRALLLGILLAATLPLPLTRSANAAPVSDRCQPDPMELQNWYAVSGTLCPAGQQDLYYFSAERGDRVTIVMESRSGVDPRVQLWDCCRGDGQILTSGASRDLACIEDYRLPYSGTYAIRAGSARDKTGRYVIQLKPTGGSCRIT